MRKQLGVNLSNDTVEHVPMSSALCKAIIDFFERDDVSKMCPNKRRKVGDPDNEAIKEQVRWRLGYLSTLHLKFLAETEYSCYYAIFTKYVPFHIKKPAASDWGTCLCRICLNPELKVERLFRLGKLTRSCDLENVMKDEGSYKKFISKLKSLSSDDDISFLEWKMVDKDENNKRSKSKTKLIRKLIVVKKFNGFISNLISELGVMKEHLTCVHKRRGSHFKAVCARWST